MSLLNDIFSLRRMNDLRSDALWPSTITPFFTVTAAASSIDEGSALTVNVTGLNIPNGTYYWTINLNAGDFGTSSGSFTVTSNAGSFTVTPTADTTLEGAETFTLSIRSGSTSGIVLATTSTITINDTSTSPVAGDSFGGGYYVGKMSINGNGVATHHLVIAAASTIQTTLSWDNTVTGNSGTATYISSDINGPSNSSSLSALGSKYESAQYCENLNSGGYTDWYLPAIQELQMCYYYLKPSTTSNHNYGTSYGGPNPYAVSPQPQNTSYTSGSPPRTSSEAFQLGGSQSFGEQTYYSSSEGVGLDVYNRLTVQTVYFSDGSQSSTNKSQSWSSGVRTRAVRRIAI